MTESNNLSTESEKSRQVSESMWEGAALEAQRELRLLEAKAQQLRGAIKTFLENKKSGVMWPGISKSSDD